MSFSTHKLSSIAIFMLAAAISANAYTIKYILNGGVNDPDNPTSYASDGTTLVLKDPTREGYNFLGWFIVKVGSADLSKSIYFEEYQGKRRSTIAYYLDGNFTVEARWGLIPKTPSQDERGCYLIHSAEELYGIASVSTPNKSYHDQVRFFFNGCVSLQNDIVVNENVLDSTGKLSKEGLASWLKLGFSGTFEGNGFKISGLVGEDGLFVALGDDSGSWRAVKTHVKNLGIVDSYFYGASAGSIAGEIVGPVLVQNVYTNATVYAAEGYAGGLIGQINVTNDNCPTTSSDGASAKEIDSSRVSIIENAYSIGLVEGKYVGGITATMDAAILSNVYFAGETKGDFKDCIVQEKGYTCYESESVFNVENALCLSKDTSVSKAKSISSAQFADGTALELLSKGKNGSRWIQEIGTDAYPVIADTLQYGVRYVLNGSVNNKQNLESYSKGAKAFALYDPQKANDEFEGWFADKDFTQKIDTIRADHFGEWTVYAKWKSFFVINRVLNGAKEYIGVDKSGYSSIKYYSQTYTYWSADSTAFVLEEAYRSDGYALEGWYTDSLFTNKITEIPAGNTEDITVYAKWKYRDYTITYNLFGGENHPDNVSSWTILDSAIVLKKPTREGADFYRWTPCRLCYSVNKLTDHTSYNLYAEWFPTPQKPKQDTANCFLLTNKQELYWFAGLVNGTLKGETQNQKACASLQNDIEVNGVVVEYKKSMAYNRTQDTIMNMDADSGYVWKPIATTGSFSGTFYGNGHSISGLMTDEKCGGNVALFCSVDYPGGTVKDVEINNSHVINQGFINHLIINTDDRHALPSIAAKSDWRIDIQGNSVAFEGLTAGRTLLVMDVQGRVLRKTKTQSSMVVNFSSKGKFLIRYGRETRTITIR